jgi:hypothetical protein
LFPHHRYNETWLVLCIGNQKGGRVPILARLAALALILALAQPALAQSGPRVTADAAVVDFPAGIRFELAAESGQPLTRAELRYGADARSCLPSEARQALRFDSAAAIAVDWEWDFTRTSLLPPGVRFWWQWELEDAAGARLLTDKQWSTITDQRFTWRTATRDLVTVTWAAGDAAFGQELLDLSLRSLDRLEHEMGVRPDGPVGLVVYPTTADLTDSFVTLPEWAGGVALPAYNVVVTAIEPGQDSWASSVVPHELAHLVVGTLVFNCRGAGLPTWLNEGLAVHAEGPAAPGDLARVRQALSAGALPSLRSMANGFQADRSRALLAYAHSAEVVRWMLAEFGPERLAELLALVRAGQTIDPALEAVYGLNTDGLDAGWRVAQGFDPLPTLAPTAAPAERTPVPTLALWTAAPRQSATPPASEPPPSATPRVVAQAASPTPAVTNTPFTLGLPALSSDAPAAPQGLPGWVGGALVLAVIILAGIGLRLVLRRRR